MLHSVHFSPSVMSEPLRPHGLQDIRLRCPSPSPRACTNSCPLSRWCYPKISSSVAPSPPAFNLSHHQGLNQWDSSSHQVAKVLEISFSISPSNKYQDWYPLGSTSLISLQSKGLSRVFSCTTIRKYWFLGAQLSLRSNSHIHTWLLEKP